MEQNAANIGKVEVPVIVYAGPSDNLADVFVLLNTQGIKLHRMKYTLRGLIIATE